MALTHPEDNSQESASLIQQGRSADLPPPTPPKPYTLGHGQLPPRKAKAIYPFSELKAPDGDNCDYFEWPEREGKMRARLYAAITNREINKPQEKYRLIHAGQYWRVYRIK